MRGWPVLGIGPAFRADPIGTIVGAIRAHGDIVALAAGGEPMCLVNHPDHVKHVLQDNASSYHKGFSYDRIRPLLGNGLLTSEGDLWKRQRRLAQPAFHRGRIASFAATMVARCDAMLDRWAAMPEDAPIDLHAELSRVTLEIVCETLFSTDVAGSASRVASSLEVVLRILNERLMRVVVHSLPTPENLRLRRAVRELDDVVDRVIAERRRVALDAHDDLLSMLMGATDAETGEGMSDAQLRDEAMTIILAGHETTANAIAWTFHRLARHPDIAERLVAEVHAVLGDRAPTAEDARRLPFTSRVLDESMRLHPPAWIISRKAMSDDVIGGYRVPAGTTVLVSPYTLHRHPGFWEDPERFDPDRFTPERSEARPRHAYIPFASGARFCIGSNFALLEAVLLIARIAQTHRLAHVPGAAVTEEALITLRPRGLVVTRTPRPAPGEPA